MAIARIYLDWNATAPLLGVARDADMATIKAAYRKLVRENHPDALIAKGLPQEFIDLAQEKMSALNTAYERIEKERRG